jgi:hypothetical protein
MVNQREELVIMNFLGLNRSRPQVTPLLPRFDNRGDLGNTSQAAARGSMGHHVADAFTRGNDSRAQAKATGRGDNGWGWTGFQSSEWDRNLRGGAGIKLHDYSAKNSFYENKYSNQLDVAQPKSDPKPPEWGYNASLFSVGTKAWADLANVQGSTTLLGGVEAKGEAYALRLEGRGGASAGVDLKSGQVSAKASVGASAHLVGVKGSVSRQLGSDANNITLKANTHAYVGADADAHVEAILDPAKGTAKLGIGVDAFAGAKARAAFRPSINLGGQHIADVGVKGEAWAGIGAKAKATAGVEDGVFTVKAELGAALGVGASVGFDVSVDVVGTAKAIEKGVDEAVDAVGDVVEDVAEVVSEAAGDAVDAVQDAASDVADAASGMANNAKKAAKSAWKSVKSWF